MPGALASLDPGRIVPDGVHDALSYPFIGRHHPTSWEGLAHDVQFELIRRGFDADQHMQGLI